jgi:beta-phosphoglucomutase-like phosphatase (HAD superfamily)
MVDSELVLAECIVEVLAELGVDVGFESFGHLFGTVDADAEWDRLCVEWLGPGALTSRQLEDLVEPRLGGRLDTLALKPGVATAIDAAAAAGWRTGVGTGQARRRLEPRLGRLGVLDRIDTIVTRHEVPRGKPHPDIFLEVARRLDVPPTECVVLEDSLPGVQAALAAGMVAVVCPSPVSAHCAFPIEAVRVTTLEDLDAPRLLARA